MSEWTRVQPHPDEIERLEGIIDERDARIAELEKALGELVRESEYMRTCGFPSAGYPYFKAIERARAVLAGRKGE